MVLLILTVSIPTISSTKSHMKTQYFTAASIDGFITDNDESLDWLFQFGSIDSMEEEFPLFMGQVGAAVMGSSTYEWLIEMEEMIKYPKKWPYDIPTWVFSHRDLPIVDKADITFVKGDVSPVHSEMGKAANGKNIWIIGGGDLAGQFYDRGLLDEVIITIAPVMLGSGAPLLPRDISSKPLKLVDVQKHEDVFAVLTYSVQK